MKENNLFLEIVVIRNGRRAAKRGFDLAVETVSNGPIFFFRFNVKISVIPLIVRMLWHC